MRLSFGILGSILVARSEGLECIQCEHTKNSLGESDGSLGNANCWENAAEIDSYAECKGVDETCVTEMHVRWDPYGKQTYTIARGCGIKTSESDWMCSQYPEANFQTKDCYEFCSTDKCNVYMSIENLFASGNMQEQCEACRYHKTDSGMETGNLNCLANGAGNRIRCPTYAQYGCYIGTSAHNTPEGEYREDAYRGCSAFPLEASPSCTAFEIVDDTTGESAKYGTCKEVCVGPTCNVNEPTHPDLDWEYPSCQVCSETRDQEGNMVGTGQAGCFNGNSKFEQKCPRTTDKCATEMQIDWFAKGDHQYKVSRRCAPTEPSKPCMDGSSEIFQYKDCIHTCDPKEDGDGCNSDLSQVEDLISTSTVTQCHTCQFYQSSDGQVNGNNRCGGGGNSVPKVACPRYADASCYTAASYHRDYQANVEEREDDYRGCSPFLLPEDSWEHCGTASINGFDHVNCKTTCTDNNCNNQPTNNLGSAGVSCFTCSATRDSQGNSVGLSDDACFEGLKSEFIEPCSGLDAYCKDEMLIDWFPKGHQQITIMRGCYSPPQNSVQPKPLCSESSSSSLNFQFRDCTYYCDSALCNFDMAVGELHASDNGQDICTTCSFVEHDDGVREGYPQCMNAQPNRPKECPVYATHGCYTANSVHNSADGSRRKQVHRGCSSFDHEFRDCYEQTLKDEQGNEDNWGVCKEFCTGPNCNNKLPATPEAGYTWPSCLVCESVVDNDNKTVGLSSHDCWDLDADHPELAPQYLERCPKSTDRCITEMMIDWLPRGNVQYLVRRFCSNEAPPRMCSEGHSSLVEYKDCKVGCNPLDPEYGAGCNQGLEEVGNMFSMGNVKECHQCSFSQDIDTGEELGDKGCRNPNQSGFEFTCPSYATASCFEAASFHEDYGASRNEFEEDYRGCSPFLTTNLQEEQRCTDMMINNIQHTNCRRNCYGDNCNKEPLRRGKQCYACSGNRDGQGRPVGVGDDNCFDNVGNNHLVDCAPDQDICTDEVLIDWLPKGNQITTIMRGCGKSKVGNLPCYEGSGTSLMYKDCQVHCSNENGACNKGGEVFDEFRPNTGDRVTKCFGCYWEEHDDGTVEGNRNCRLGAADIPNGQVDCPNYATQACFTGESIHNDYGRNRIQVYKGCSAFGIADESGGMNGVQLDDLTLPDDSNNIVGYSIVKQTCDSRSCNDEHQLARPPNEIGSSFCQVCSVTVDMYNKTVGVGQLGCWLGDASYNQECGVGQYCTTDLETDWLPKGNIQYRLVRGCAKTLTPTPCEETYTPYYAYKDCKVNCNPMEDGQGCNKGLEHVARKFDAGDLRVNSCYQCHHYKTVNGEEFGKPTCSAQIDDVTNIGRVSCPLYANQGCYHAASFHLDYVDDNTEYEDDYRGCSPFVSSNGHPPINNNGNNTRYQCHHMELEGIDHENCKSVCASDDCNKGAARNRPTCYTCQATYDSAGNLIGVGDDRCMDVRGGDHMVQTCPRDMPICMTEMQVDWVARGYQQMTIRRGCTKYEAPEPCYYQANERIKYKDCYESCYPSEANGTAACNNDLKVQDKFFMGPPLQQQCYTCKYIETDNGDLEGQKDCGSTPPDNWVMKSCPAYATAACYTGSAVHKDPNGNEVEEVYKGCSTFRVDNGVESIGAELDGVAYALVKQTCSGEKCNTGHQRPVLPYESNDTGSNAGSYRNH